MQTTQLRIPQVTLATADRVCKIEGRKRSDVLREAMTLGLSQMMRPYYAMAEELPKEKQPSG